MTDQPVRQRCGCGAPLGRKGKCPKLCEPVEAPPPKYTGPAVVGKSHTQNLLNAGFGPGWIGS